jgi:hypothetical protein
LLTWWNVARDRARFFEPLQFHLEASNLLKEFGFAGGLGLLVAGALLAEEGAPLLQELLLPLRNLGRMHLVFAGELAERLLLLERGERHPKLEVRTPLLAFFRHHPLHMRCRDRSRSLLRMWSRFWDQL